MESSDKNCGCNSCNLIGIILGIAAGVATGLLFSMGLIPVILNFIKVALVMAAISLAVIIAALLLDRLGEGCGFKKCICRNGGLLFAGVIGTLISATAAATAGLVATQIVSAVFVGLTAFFFTIMIVALICLVVCMLNKTCY